MADRYHRPSAFSDKELRALDSNHRLRHTLGAMQHFQASYKDLYAKYMLAGSTITAGEWDVIRGFWEPIFDADRLKQRGLYTDFNAASGTWGGPAEVSRDDFDSIQSVVTEFVGETERQVAEILDSGPPES